MNHCYKTTQKVREEMEAGRRRMETDYVEFPGKMDHTTLVCYVMGMSSDVVLS